MSSASTSPAGQQKSEWGQVSRTSLALLVLAMVLCAMGYLFQPKLATDVVDPNTLERLIPTSFGDWREVKSQVPHVDTSVPGELSEQQPYDAQVMRTYRNSAGEMIMIAVAYGRNQRQEIKVHRPEVCYPAAGRQVSSVGPTSFPLTSSSGAEVIGTRMIAYDRRRGYQEPVSYWIRIGHIFSQSGLTQRVHILTEGLKGRRADGILVRFSQIISPQDDPEASYELQKRFAVEMVAAMPPEGRKLLID